MFFLWEVEACVLFSSLVMFRRPDTETDSLFLRRAEICVYVFIDFDDSSRSWKSTWRLMQWSYLLQSMVSYGFTASSVYYISVAISNRIFSTITFGIS